MALIVNLKTNDVGEVSDHIAQDEQLLKEMGYAPLVVHKSEVPLFVDADFSSGETATVGLQPLEQPDVDPVVTTETPTEQDFPLIDIPAKTKRGRGKAKNQKK